MIICLPYCMYGKCTKMTFFPTERQMHINIPYSFSTIVKQRRQKMNRTAHYMKYQQDAHFIIQMIVTDLEELNTLQQYLACLFDSLQPITLAPEWLANLQGKERICQKLIDLSMCYGKKIMEMSEQSTFKYRKEHFVDRKGVQKQIGVIYRLITGQNSEDSYQVLVKSIIEKLQWDRKTIWAKQSLPQSRIIVSEQKSQNRREKALEQERSSNVSHNKPSRIKAIKASRASTVKEVLQIKGCFEQQQGKIRQFFDKLNRMLELNKVTTTSLSAESLRYSKSSDQNNSDKLIDLVKNSSQNHHKNIDNLLRLVDLLHDNLQKKLKNQGVAEAKLNLFLEQALRMQQTYSYTLSKMLQNLSEAKTILKKDPELCFIQLQNLQEITRKLYGIYPSQEALQQISVRAKGINEGSKSMGVQVNMSKGQSEKKSGSQAFRLQVRIAQCLQKFQRNTKFRKTFQSKQIQKLIQMIREVIPNKTAANQSEIVYQQQFKKMIELQQNREKQLIDVHSKKCKKMQKKIGQLEQQLLEAKHEAGNVGQQWQQQRKRLQKKLQSEQGQYRKIINQKNILENSIGEMMKEIEQMRQAVRKQGDQEINRRRMLQKQREELKQKIEIANRKLNEGGNQIKNQKSKISEERSIYRQKIQLIENKLEEEKELSTGLRVQLEAVIADNRAMRQQLQEMSKIYQDKIKQVEQMIQNIGELQSIKRNQQIVIQQLNSTISNYAQKMQNQQKDIKQYLKKNQQLQKERLKLKTQFDQWKEEGRLTDSDLKVLRDQVQKVNSAYIEVEQQLEITKKQLYHTSEEREKLFREKLKLNRFVQDLEGQLHTTRAKYQALELAERDLKDQFYQKCQQSIKSQKQYEDLKRESSKIRKQLGEERQERAKTQKQLRQFRQQNQSKRESESLQHGKKRMQLQGLKVQVRRKNEMLQKQRQSYEQKIGLLSQRLKQMQQCVGQKQMLAKLLHAHQSN